MKYAYQIKLRDTGSYGFLLPKTNIVPTGQEGFGAVMALARYLLGNRGVESDWEDFGITVNGNMVREEERGEEPNTNDGEDEDIVADAEGGMEIDGEDEYRMSWNSRRRKRR